MDFTLLALAACGFFGGLMVVSRTLRWALGLLAVLRSPALADGSRPARSWPAQAILHSGPWALALAVGAVWVVARQARPEGLWALVGGLVVAMLFFAGVMVRFRPGAPQAAPQPLTPERLARIRRQFFTFTIVGWTVAYTVGMTWAMPDDKFAIAVLTLIVSPLGGWLFAWVFWQWVGASLEVGEKRRAQQDSQR